MKGKYYKDAHDMFEKYPEAKKEFKELYEVIELILHAIDLQEQSNEVNKKLSELNKEEN